MPGIAASVAYLSVRFIARCWELRENLTVYDDAYVALAEIMDLVLVSADAGLAGASGTRCEIELIA